jgi:hypothetical protein
MFGEAGDVQDGVDEESPAVRRAKGDHDDD